MRKFLIGIVIIASLAVAGYFGVSIYAQHRATQDVAAAFEAMRSRGTSATHGTPSFDLWTRTLIVPDVAITSAAEPRAMLKIGRIVASGLSQPAAGRISAKRIEISDVDAGYTLTLQTAMKLSYKAPQIVLDDYSGPAAPLRSADTNSVVDMARFWLEHVSAVTLASLSIPTLTAHVEPTPAERLPALGAFSYVYTGVAMRDLRVAGSGHRASNGSP